jgi:hypothetical protein
MTLPCCNAIGKSEFLAELGSSSAQIQKVEYAGREIQNLSLGGSNRKGPSTMCEADLRRHKSQCLRRHRDEAGSVGSGCSAAGVLRKKV